MFLIRKKISRAIVLLLIVAAGPAVGSGGDWKMGPFGPYWDDNSWPEFTPMYWMEEFMNHLDDDDDEIQTWMLRNQFPGQYPGAWTGTDYPQDGWRPDAWTGSRAQSRDRSYPKPYTGALGGNTYIIGDNNPLLDAPGGDPGPLPFLTPEEFARMPVDLQREYKRAFDREYPIVSAPERDTEREPLPDLNPQEYARMPADMQREYKRAFDRENPGGARRPPDFQQRRPLPHMTPEQYARMPAERQREYKRAFDREHYGSVSRPSYSERRPVPERERQRLPNLTLEEFSRMPVELQREYKRAFDREYAEYRAHQADLARQRQNDLRDPR